MSVTFEGTTHLLDVGIFSTGVDLPASAVDFHAVDCEMRGLTLASGTFQRVDLTSCQFSGAVVLNGGGSFQYANLNNCFISNGGLTVTGAWSYGFYAQVRVNTGTILLDGVTDAVLDIVGSNLVTVILNESHRNTIRLNTIETSQHGIRFTDSSDNRVEGHITNAGRQTTNTYDGVFMDGDSDRNRTALTVTYLGSGSQMRYGANISASTCDNNVEASILTGSGATGNFNDAGTGTVLTDDHIV